MMLATFVLSSDTNAIIKQKERSLLDFGTERSLARKFSYLALSHSHKNPKSNAACEIIFRPNLSPKLSIKLAQKRLADGIFSCFSHKTELI